MHHCKRLQLTSENDWDPNNYDGLISKVTTCESNNFDESSILLSENLAQVLAAYPILYNNNDIYSSINAIQSKSKAAITPKQLSNLWNIGLSIAKQTLSATTQKCTRTTGLLSKRYKTDRAQLRYKQMKRQFGTFYVDYLKVSSRSVQGYIGGTLYTNKLGFKKFFPHEDETGKSTASGFRTFIDMIGLPYSIHSDGHNNFSEGPFRKLLCKFGILQSFTEPHSPWQNRAECAIGETKQYAQRLMQSTRTRVRLWCFCYEYAADVLSLCATGRYDLRGRTPYEHVFNYTPDISELVAFSWFQWCYYFDEHSKSKNLCRWLGPAHSIGQSFCLYLLLENGSFITRSSVIPVQKDELNTQSFKDNSMRFMKSVEEKIGNHKDPLFQHDNPDGIYFIPFQDEQVYDETITPYGDKITEAITTEIDEPYLESLDQYIGANVVIPGTTKGVEPVLAVIKGRKRDHNGNPIGNSNPNPILDSRVYELQFPDRRVEDYSMNVIVENLLAQTDQHGYDLGIFEEIVDF